MNLIPCPDVVGLLGKEAAQHCFCSVRDMCGPKEHLQHVLAHIVGTRSCGSSNAHILLMVEILHYLKDPKLWELWYVPYYGQCRISIINRMSDSI